jgi:hypothetical protein
VNEALTARPELVNEDCYGEGWMLVIRPSGDPTAGPHGRGAYGQVRGRAVVIFRARGWDAGSAVSSSRWRATRDQLPAGSSAR